jgi:hypothetical protein
VADAAKKIFVIVATHSAAAIGAKIAELALTKHEIKNDTWLVLYPGTARELAELLQIRGDPYIGSGIVFPIEGYSGRADKGIWEWLQLNWPKDG